MSNYQKLPGTAPGSIIWSLGAINKQTGKPFPKKIEGFYQGFREVQDKRNTGKMAKVHLFQTSSGAQEVWGKTHLNSELKKLETLFLNKGVSPCVLAAKTDETQKMTNGDMILFDVQVDPTNTIPYAGYSEPETGETYTPVDAAADDATDTEEALDEVPPQRPVAPARATSPGLGAQTRAQAFLNGRNKS